MKNIIIVAVVLALVGCNVQPRPKTPKTDQQPQAVAQEQPQAVAVKEVKLAPVEVQQPDPPTPKEEKPLEVVVSKNPFTDFLDNVAAAMAKYDGKGLEVNGLVKSVTKAKNNPGFVVFIQGYGNGSRDDDRGNYCRFVDGDSITMLKAGFSRVRLQGRFLRWDRRERLMVDECKLLEVLEPGQDGKLKTVWPK